MSVDAVAKSRKKQQGPFTREFVSRTCKDCGADYETRAGNAFRCDPCAVREYEAMRERKWLARWGFTPESFRALNEKQEWRCAVCKRLPLEASKRKNLCVDHDHETGAIRGLLCAPCNMALGLMQDNLAILLQAVKYLQAAAEADATTTKEG